MKHISILVLEDAVPASIVDPRYMFTAINQFLEDAGNEPAFSVELIGLTKEVRLNKGIFAVYTDNLINNVTKTDLIIIPALSGDLKATIEKNKAFIPWIINHYENGRK